MFEPDRFLRIVALFSLLLYFAPGAKAQSPYVDSLLQELKIAKNDTNKVKLLNELCWELAYLKTEDAIQYGKNSISLSRKLKYPGGESTGHYYLSRIYLDYGDAKSALEQASQALEIDEKRNDSWAIASDYGQIGACHKAIGDYEKAAFHYYKSLELFEELGDLFTAAKMKLNIANFSFAQNENDVAMKLAREARIEFEKMGARLMLARTLSMEATALSNQKQWEYPLTLYRGALSIYQEEGNEFGEAETFNNIGAHFHSANKLDSALYYLERALSMHELSGRKTFQAVTSGNIALVYLDMEEHEKSVEYIEKSIAIGKEVGELKEVANMMSYAAEIHYSNGQYKKAYDYFELAKQMNDTLLSEKKIEQILDIKEKYETEKKAQEISMLKKERDASEAKSRLVDTVIIFSIGIILLLVILGMFIFKQRKAREQQRKVELEQKVLRAQMSPHFIFNSLNSIQRIFIEGDEDLANDYISDFGKLLRIIMENSGKDQVSLKSEIETLKLYLDIEMIRLDGKIEYSFDIDPNLDQFNNFIPPLIVQPFVENAIWHGILPKEGDEKGEIRIYIERQSNQFLKCVIVDNGIGIEQSRKLKANSSHKSKGMSITQERLGTKVQAKEIESGGTEIILTIPLNK